MYWGLCRAVSNLVSSEVHVKYSFEVQREGFDIKNTIKAGGSTARAWSKMCEWVMGDGWVIPLRLL